MQRRAWIAVSGLLIAASAAWAQGAPAPSPALPREAPKAPVEKPVVRAVKEPRVIDGLVDLRIHQVVDGRVIAGMALPQGTIDALLTHGFVKVTKPADIRPEVIHDGRLYRSYRIAEGSRLRASDLRSYEGREVKARISEIIPGQQYAIIDLM